MTNTIKVDFKGVVFDVEYHVHAGDKSVGVDEQTIITGVYKSGFEWYQDDMKLQLLSQSAMGMLEMYLDAAIIKERRNAPKEIA